MRSGQCTLERQHSTHTAKPCDFLGKALMAGNLPKTNSWASLASSSGTLLNGPPMDTWAQIGICNKRSATNMMTITGMHNSNIHLFTISVPRVVLNSKYVSKHHNDEAKNHIRFEEMETGKIAMSSTSMWISVLTYSFCRRLIVTVNVICAHELKGMATHLLHKVLWNLTKRAYKAPWKNRGKNRKHLISLWQENTSFGERMRKMWM